MDNIKSSIVSLFPIEKIRADFEEWFVEESLEYDVPFVIEERDTQKPLTITISKNEKMTIFHINMHIDLFGNIDYYVFIALGAFIPFGENGIAGMEKGILRISYNEELSLYKANFYYFEIYHLKFLRSKS